MYSGSYQAINLILSKFNQTFVKNLLAISIEYIDRKYVDFVIYLLIAISEWLRTIKGNNQKKSQRFTLLESTRIIVFSF